MRLKLAGLIAMTAVALTTAAHAQETIKLKVGGFLPSNHFQVINGTQVWMDEVTRLTNGQVVFEYYPAQQIGKATELLNLLTAGVVDVAEVPPAYVTDKLPLIGVLEMPGLVPDTCTGAHALRAVSEPGGVIYESDFTSAGVMPLTFFIYPPYSIFSRDEISSLEDIDGMKLRTSGGAMELVASELGGASVRLPSPEVYQSLSRGTIDAVMYSFLSATDADFQEIVTHAAYGYGFGAPSVLISMAQSKFNSLPENVQQALVDAGVVADNSNCSYVDSHELEAVQIMTDADVTLYKFTDAEVSDLETRLAHIATDWAAELDGRGKPATQALKDFSAAINAAN